MGGSRDRKNSTTHYIGRQEAHTINNADTVNHIRELHLAPPEPTPRERAEEHLRLGDASLRQGLHHSAVTHLTECISLGALAPSAAAHARFLLALARLGGRRPSLCTTAEAAAALDLLGPLHEPHARFLAALVQEDRTNAWMGSAAVPDSLRTKARQIDRSYADLIRRHVPAPQSRVWQALDERAGGTTP
ncbi:hypothetical protein QFZ75_003794 [Streptomyces sp. V3I8]|jgi:hypothetical protein|uniref:hypothetical protein n=1 Tax=Streptomyces sp. V3I8 TaxID=3042279 RepID=UPI0027881960|nr:hypothetical protein [Streptomyces sp. V3I8]MDQ1037378.1 hypothetical protein [Streptomyces sp. V3I8]